MIADLHCHPVLNPYNTKKSIWDYEPPSDADRSAMVNTASVHFPNLAKFTQADFTSASKGDVKLIFVSLYPIEQGFMTNLFMGDTLNAHKNEVLDFLNKPIRGLIQLLESASLHRIEQVAAKVIMNISGRRFQELSSSERSYMNDLLGEYNYFLNQPQQQLIKSSPSDPGKVYTLKIVSNFAELQALLALNENLEPATTENVIAIIFSIEGAHSFGSGQLNTIPDVNFQEEVNMLNDINNVTTKKILTELIKNIDQIKNLSGGKHCPFFVTFSHHFWNQLCGHSMSLAKVMHTVFVQTRGVSSGFTELGKKIVEHLLDKTGKRILIDIKHMSVKGRIWFYNYLKENYWSKGDAVPIIASHMGVSGMAQMNENPSVYPADMDGVYEQSKWFNNWDINLSDPEILIIYESKGLIGLNMDQRILSGYALVNSVTKISKSITTGESSLLYKSIWAEPILANILHVVKTIKAKYPNATDAWNIVTIGSDLDGMIDALDAYCHSEDFKLLRVVLKEKMVLRAQVEPVLQNENIDNLLDNFFYKNSLRFLKVNFK